MLLLLAGGRICSEGWMWEERHREKQQEKHLVQYSPLTFRLVSQGPYRGRGFKLHFNQLRPNCKCLHQSGCSFSNIYCHFVFRHKLC